MSIGSWLVGWFGCDRCSAMHRRAQAAESAAAKVIRQNDHASIWMTVAYLRRWTERERRKARWWRKNYDVASEMLVEAGVSRKQIVDRIHASRERAMQPSSNPKAP